MSRRKQAEESIRRTARSHADDCDCKTCRAAAGDEQAKRDLMKHLI